MSGPDGDRTAELLGELAATGERLRACAEGGRLSELAGLLERRAVLLEDLRAASPPPGGWPEPVRALVARVREEERRALTLLLALRDDLQGAVAASRERRSAGASYRKVQGL